jgi:hypothetical protein
VSKVSKSFTYINFVVGVNQTVHAVHVRSIDICHREKCVATGIERVNDNNISELVRFVVKVTCE